MHERSVFRLLCSTLNSSTPQVQCSMHECSPACFLCCHLDTSTPQVLKSGVRYTNLEYSTPVIKAWTFSFSSPLLHPKPGVRCRNVPLFFFSAVTWTLQLWCSIHEPGLFNSGVQGMNFGFFVSSAPPSPPQLLKSSSPAFNAWMSCFFFPPLLVSSALQLLKSGVRCVNALLPVSSASTSTFLPFNSPSPVFHAVDRNIETFGKGDGGRSLEKVGDSSGGVEDWLFLVLLKLL